MSESYERLREQKEAIEARAAEREERNRWIVVTPETMPAEEDVVLVHYLFGGKESRIRTAYWQGRNWTTFPGMSRIPTPTHYMPLPAPPVLP